MIFDFTQQIKIHFQFRGNGDRSMLFLHGFGASLESWSDIEPHLSSKNRLCLLDLKGFGLSSRPEDDLYSLDHQAEIVCSFIEREGLRRLALVGHSYGGAVALLTYFKITERRREGQITSLILLDSAGYLQRLPFFVSILRIPGFNALVLNLIPAEMRARLTLRRVFHDPDKVTEERVNRYARYFDLPRSHYSFIKSARQVFPVDALSVIRKIHEVSVPTMILWGSDDPVIPLAHAHRFHREISGSELVVIPECGHVPHEEKPEETAAQICAFLEHRG